MDAYSAYDYSTFKWTLLLPLDVVCWENHVYPFYLSFLTWLVTDSIGYVLLDPSQHHCCSHYLALIHLYLYRLAVTRTVVPLTLRHRRFIVHSMFQ